MICSDRNRVIKTAVMLIFSDCKLVNIITDTKQVENLLTRYPEAKEYRIDQGMSEVQCPG